MPPSPTRGQLFLSHTHDDEPIANAIRDLFKTVFGEAVVTLYSTNKEREGGIRGGVDWFEWIVGAVRHSQVVFVLLTPQSVRKPWILWETGAVYGVALGRGDRTQSEDGSSSTSSVRIIPITFQIAKGEIPSPLQAQRGQIIEGDDKEAMRRLLTDLASRDYAEIMEKPQIADAMHLLHGALDTYVTSIKEALLRSPASATEDMVSEWLYRIEEAKGVSDARQIEQWIDVAFGRQGDRDREPIDFRIHSRLGQIYLDNKRYEWAVEQFELARRLSPRDLMLLRKLGQAQLNSKNRMMAAKLIDTMKELDEEIFTTNAESAAFAARVASEDGDWEVAIDYLTAASKHNRKSYYLADLLGQAQIKGDRLKDAKKTYRRARALLEDERTTIWTLATGITACLVLDDELSAGVRNAKKIMKEGPSLEERATILRGARELAKQLSKDITPIEEILG